MYPFLMLHAVLFEPEIPQNTGNIARTCAATGTVLELVYPLGFDISEKAVRHAGLDYWKDVTIKTHDSIESFMQEHKGGELFFFSTKARTNYAEMKYPTDGDVYFIFGKESAGVPEEILLEHPKRCVRIPMVNDTRSLNLSNSVAIAVYEYYRQANFPGEFKTAGKLHAHSWEEAGK